MRTTCRRYLVVAAAGIVAFFLVESILQSWVYNLIGLSAAGAMFAGIGRNGPEPRTAWVLLASGILVLVAGDIVYGTSQPVPSPADMLYISAYPLLILGVVGLVPSRREDREEPSFIVAAAAAASVGLLAWMFLLAPTDGRPGIGLSTLVVSVGYPVLDLAMLGILVTAVRRSGSRTPSVGLLLAGVLFLLAADVWYALLDFGTAYSLGAAADAAWLLAYACFGAAALHPSARSEQLVAVAAPVSFAGPGNAAAIRFQALRFRFVVSWSGRLVAAMAVGALMLGAGSRSVDLVVFAGALGTAGSLMVLVAGLRS